MVNHKKQGLYNEEITSRERNAVAWYIKKNRNVPNRLELGRAQSAICSLLVNVFMGYQLTEGQWHLKMNFSVLFCGWKQDI